MKSWKGISSSKLENIKRKIENENVEYPYETTTRLKQKKIQGHHGSVTQRENPASGGGLQLASTQ